MDTGKLRHRVTLITQTESVTNGKISISDGSSKTLWARVTPKAQAEAVANSKVQATASYEIQLRYVSGIRTKDILVYGGKRLQITSILNTDERNIELLVTASEVK